MTNEMIPLLTRWQTIRQQLDAVKPLELEEKEIRQKLFNLAFPNPTEGTNRIDLTDGYALKGTFKVTRKIDEAALPAVIQQLQQMNVPPDMFFNYTPELKVTQYKQAAPQVKLAIDAILTSKPGLPSLEIELPKKGK